MPRRKRDLTPRPRRGTAIVNGNRMLRQRLTKQQRAAEYPRNDLQDARRLARLERFKARQQEAKPTP